MLQMKNGAIKATGNRNRREATVLPGGRKAVCAREARTGDREARRQDSDRQRHKAVVLLDVSLEDI